MASSGCERNHGERAGASGSGLSEKIDNVYTHYIYLLKRVLMFEWDKKKNAANRKKHGISFEEAKEIFDGPVLTRLDDRREYGETRRISIGALSDAVVIVVAHTDRAEKIRIISARKANRNEREVYYEYLEKALGRD